MKRPCRWGLLISLILSATAEAAMIDFKPLGMEVKTGDRMVIHGFDGDVVLVAGKGNQLQVKVKQENSDNLPPGAKQVLDEWNFSFQRMGDVIVMEVQSPQAKQAWRQILLSGGAPKFHLEVIGPAIPAEVSWRSGKIRIENWQASLRATLQEGAVVVLGGQGDLKAVGQATDITVKNRAGHVRIESYSGKVVADDIKGALDLENFAGDSVVGGNEGPLELKSYKGVITVNGGRGRIDFEIARSQLKINNFNGDLKGTADQGSITAKVLGPNEVRVTTQEGPVILDLPDSGANVHATSVDGAVQGPAPLKAEQLAGARVMRGRLKGKVEGTVVVRTQSGPIRIR